MKEIIATDRGPKAIGPYSQAIRANGFVFLSGQIPFDPATGELVTGDVADPNYARARKRESHRRGCRLVAR